MEAIHDCLSVVAPVVVIIDGDKIARRRPIPFLDLPDEILAMESDLLFRLPKLRQPKPDHRCDQSPGAEADLKGRVHGLFFRVAGGSFHGETIHLKSNEGLGMKRAYPVPSNHALD